MVSQYNFIDNVTGGAKANPHQDTYNLFNIRSLEVQISTPYAIGQKVELPFDEYLEFQHIVGVKIAPPDNLAAPVDGDTSTVTPKQRAHYWSRSLYLTIKHRERDKMYNINSLPLTDGLNGMTSNRNLVPFQMDFTKSYIRILNDPGGVLQNPPAIAGNPNVTERSVLLNFYFIPYDLPGITQVPR